MVLIVAVVLWIFLAINPQGVFAAQNILINEFMVHPADNKDWVEIYNPTNATINLSGYKINDSTSQFYEFLTGNKIGAGCFLAIEAGYQRLNNGGDAVYLFDNSGVQIDSKNYSVDPGVDASWQRQPDGGEWQTSSNITRGVSNSGNSDCHESESNQENQNSQSVNIELSEFMPSPSEGDEWVELRNKNNYASDISGYQVDDIDGGSSPFTLQAGSVIPVGGYWILDMPKPGKFNNDKDTIRLLNPSGSVLESFDYSDPSPGVSYAKDSSNTWKQTTTPTKADQNQINSPTTNDSSNKATESEENPTSKVATSPVTKQLFPANQVLGSKLAEATSGTDERGVRNFTYSLDKADATKDASKTEEPNSSYPIGLVIIFWGALVLLVVSIILKQRGFFDKIKLH